MSHLREIATVLSNDADGDALLLRLRAPALAAAARPFQFVLVKVPGEGFLLRRPFSVFDAAGDEVALLVRPVGEGTASICRLTPGGSCDLTGPFGRAFDVPDNTLFVAGGIGIAGVFYAVAAAARSGRKAELIYGVRDATQLYVKGLIGGLNVEATVVTEDGSSGRKGLATDFIPVPPSGETGNGRAVVACGPRPMYAALRRVLGDDAQWYALMEERMACGVGACRACAVPVREPAGSYAAVCKDGPLVDAATIDWGRLGEAV